MKNPPTRPYTPEELELLFREERCSTSCSTAGKEVVILPVDGILQNNQTTSPFTEATVLTPAAMSQKRSNQLARYTPFIVLGIIVVGVGIYLYYEHRKNEENEARKNRLN